MDGAERRNVLLRSERADMVEIGSPKSGEHSVAIAKSAENQQCIGLDHDLWFSLWV